MFDLTYPFDPTGQAPTNKVTNELHTLAAPGVGDFHFIIPRSGPYFRDSLKIFRVSDNSELKMDQHWVPSFAYDGAQRQAVNLYGGATITDRSISGQLRVEYQTIGGEWAVDDAKIANIILNLVIDPRAAYWEEVVGYPNQFPVINHDFSIDDLTGMGEVVEQLAELNSVLKARLVGNQKKGRYVFPPIRSVRNSANVLVTVDESWTNFARVSLNLPLNGYPTDISFRLFGARPEGVGAVVPEVTFQILMNRNTPNGIMQPDAYKRVDHNAAGAALNVYAAISEQLDSLGETKTYLNLWIKDTRLRGAVQVQDLTEHSIEWVPVPYASSITELVLSAPAAILPFVV